jgi:hypothetical protein
MPPELVAPLEVLLWLVVGGALVVLSKYWIL